MGKLRLKQDKKKIAKQTKLASEKYEKSLKKLGVKLIAFVLSWVIAFVIEQYISNLCLSHIESLNSYKTGDIMTLVGIDYSSNIILRLYLIRVAACLICMLTRFMVVINASFVVVHASKEIKEYKQERNLARSWNIDGISVESVRLVNVAGFILKFAGETFNMALNNPDTFYISRNSIDALSKFSKFAVICGQAIDIVTIVIIISLGIITIFKELMHISDIHVARM